jgi:hypothetical protein
MGSAAFPQEKFFLATHREGTTQSISQAYSLTG